MVPTVHQWLLHSPSHFISAVFESAGSWKVKAETTIATSIDFALNIESLREVLFRWVGFITGLSPSPSSLYGGHSIISLTELADSTTTSQQQQQHERVRQTQQQDVCNEQTNELVYGIGVIEEREQLDVVNGNIMQPLLSSGRPRSKIIDELVDIHYIDNMPPPQCCDEYATDVNDFVTSTTATTTFNSHQRQAKDNGVFFEQQLQSLATLLAEITPPLPNIDEPTTHLSSPSSPELHFNCQQTDC
eukprot:GHVS01083540.1.p1 GENE.GHVS01083540.1~~GHVS01083540.1.p1  ORF type:complete len:246 (+),score=60.05 GHVS01083540.1:136-873(+)